MAKYYITYRTKSGNRAYVLKKTSKGGYGYLAFTKKERAKKALAKYKGKYPRIVKV